MADKWPLANGNWSNAANWNNGTLPTVNDDVFADGKTVDIDQNVTVSSIRTTQRPGGTVGGGFTLPPNITVTANIFGQSNFHCLTRSAAGNPSFVVGNVQGSIANGSNGSGILNTSSGIVNITGNVTGGIGGSDGGLNSNAALISNGTGGFIVTGNVTAGGNGASGINFFGSGTLSVNGQLLGNGSNVAIAVNGTATVTLSISINPVNTTTAVTVGQSADVTVVGTIQNYGNVPCISSGSSLATIRLTGNMIDGPNGCPAITGFRIWVSSGFHQKRTNTGGSNAGPLLSFTSATNAGQPAASNVRLGIVFGAANEFTGSCAIPPAASVAYGVPVDNTTGTAILTGPTLRSELGMAAANLDAQLSTLSGYIDTEVAAIKAKTDNLPADPADASDIAASFASLPSAIADAVWEENMAGHTTNGTYGGRIVRASNSNVTVQITGSNHVAADIHELQPQVIDSTHFAPGAIDTNALAADAVTEIQAGLGTIDNQRYLLSILAGATSNAGTAGETYVITIGGSTYTVTYAGLDATGNRGTTAFAKT